MGSCAALGQRSSASVKSRVEHASGDILVTPISLRGGFGLLYLRDFVSLTPITAVLLAGDHLRLKLNQMLNGILKTR